MSDKPLLIEFGRRLRAARLQRGLGVAELAQAAGLSRRYLTEAEAGRANPSLLALAALCSPLRLSIGELVDLSLPGRTSERVALIGLRGAGKSSVGRALALALEVPFIELDARVEELAGLSLAEIFALHGEQHFERLEGEALERVLGEGERCVIAAGGSIVTHERNFERLRAACRTVWLSATPEEHFTRVLAQGDRRPMANRPRARAELAALLEQRVPLYARAEIALDTSGQSVAAIVHQLHSLLATERPG